MKLPKDIQRTARRKLIYIDDAENLQDLIAPPGNWLEKLKGDRAEQYISELMTNGEFASNGLKIKPETWKLLIITHKGKNYG
jgi:hypothetical protein